MRGLGGDNITLVKSIVCSSSYIPVYTLRAIVNCELLYTFPNMFVLTQWLRVEINKFK